MAKQKAKEFIQYLVDNPEVTEKMKGFTMEEFKSGIEDFRKEGKIKEADEVIPHTY